MAYPTLPSTFVSGGTIYSTAVSGNIAAVLTGYTTGAYDAYLSSATVSGPVNITGAAGNLYVANKISAASGVFTSKVTVTGTFVASGAADVAGALTVTGDVCTVPWTALSTASAGCLGWNTANVPTYNYRYKKVGKTVFVQLSISGTVSATTASFLLPYTAGASQLTVSLPLQVIVTPPQPEAHPGAIALATATQRVNVYRTMAEEAWTAAGNAGVLGHFFYEVD